MSEKLSRALIVRVTETIGRRFDHAVGDEKPADWFRAFLDEHLPHLPADAGDTEGEPC